MKRIPTSRLFGACAIVGFAAIVGVPAPVTGVPDGATARPGVPFGVVFKKDSIQRSNGFGDNWNITWGKEDQITSMCDGQWIPGGNGYHNRLYRIVGGPDEFVRSDIENYPRFDASPDSSSWFGYGIVSVGGTLYSFISKTPENWFSGPFLGLKLLKSPDAGETWYRINHSGEARLLGSNDPIRNTVSPREMFFYQEEGLPHKKVMSYPFAWVSVLQQGRDNSAAHDEYVYIYSTEGAHSNRLLLARAPAKRLGFRDAWEYFSHDDRGAAVWTSELSKRGTVAEFLKKNAEGEYFGWYSWLPSVVWNPGLKLYIMVNGGTYAGKGMTDSDEDYYAYPWGINGSLGFWYAENPWGPWQNFYYTDHWGMGDRGILTYQPKLSPKWISPDGREMVLIWSENISTSQHEAHYNWNQMKVVIQTH